MRSTAELSGPAISAPSCWTISVHCTGLGSPATSLAAELAETVVVDGGIDMGKRKDRAAVVLLGSLPGKNPATAAIVNAMPLSVHPLIRGSWPRNGNKLEF
jgi:hypothetical protein